MKDFNALKDMWQQAKPTEQKAVDLSAITRQSKDTKTKLFRQLLFGGITLFLTVVFITWMMYFSDMKLTWFITHIAIWIINTTVLLQSALTLFTAYKVSLIDDTLPPAQHLQQWENYYAFRKKQIQWNKPLYFLFLNLGMGLYFLEVVHGRPIAYIILLILVYCGWMLYAYFILGKRILAKEEKRLKGIMDELKLIEEQLKAE
jgi:hypothetical protein